MKNIIITGAANGLGKSISKRFEKENLILIDNDEVNLKEIAEILGAKYYVCDLSSDNEIEVMFEKILTDYDHIDCLINNAGMWISGDVSKMEDKKFSDMNELIRLKKVVDTNVFGVIAMIKKAYPLMKGEGQIININSQSGVTCEPPFPVYNSTKTASNAFRKAIQSDLAQNNIKITDICPGLIKTDFYKRANDELPQFIMDNGLAVDDVVDMVEFVFNSPHHITIPTLEVRHINNY